MNASSSVCTRDSSTPTVSSSTVSTSPTTSRNHEEEQSSFVKEKTPSVRNMIRLSAPEKATVQTASNELDLDDTVWLTDSRAGVLQGVVAHKENASVWVQLTGPSLGKSHVRARMLPRKGFCVHVQKKNFVSAPLERVYRRFPDEICSSQSMTCSWMDTLVKQRQDTEISTFSSPQSRRSLGWYPFRKRQVESLDHSLNPNGTVKDENSVQFATKNSSLCDRDLNFLGKLLSANESIAFCLWDPLFPETGVVFGSPAFSRLIGYPIQKVLNSNLHFLQGSQTDVAHAKAVSDAFQRSDNLHLVLLHYFSGEESFFHRMFVTPLCDERHRVRYYLSLHGKANPTDAARINHQEGWPMPAIFNLKGTVVQEECSSLHTDAKVLTVLESGDESGDKLVEGSNEDTPDISLWLPDFSLHDEKQKTPKKSKKKKVSKGTRSVKTRQSSSSVESMETSTTAESATSQGAVSPNPAPTQPSSNEKRRRRRSTKHSSISSIESFSTTGDTKSCDEGSQPKLDFRTTEAESTPRKRSCSKTRASSSPTAKSCSTSGSTMASAIGALPLATSSTASLSPEEMVRNAKTSSDARDADCPTSPASSDRSTPAPSTEETSRIKKSPTKKKRRSVSGSPKRKHDPSLNESSKPEKQRSPSRSRSRSPRKSSIPRQEKRNSKTSGRRPPRRSTERNKARYPEGKSPRRSLDPGKSKKHNKRSSMPFTSQGPSTKDAVQAHSNSCPSLDFVLTEEELQEEKKGTNVDAANSQSCSALDYVPAGVLSRMASNNSMNYVRGRQLSQHTITSFSEPCFDMECGTDPITMSPRAPPVLRVLGQRHNSLTSISDVHDVLYGQLAPLPTSYHTATSRVSVTDYNEDAIAEESTATSSAAATTRPKVPLSPQASAVSLSVPLSPNGTQHTSSSQGSKESMSSISQVHRVLYNQAPISTSQHSILDMY